MLSEETGLAPTFAVHPPLWASEPAGGQDSEDDDDEWEDYELEEPSDEDDELDDEEEIEDWSEDEEE
jgi:hypothetical protein